MQTVQTPMKHSLSEWIATTRYWSFSVSAFPAIVAIAYVATLPQYSSADIRWGCALLAVVGAVLFHAAGNLLSDVGDYRSGADCAEAYAVPNLVQQRFTPRQYLTLSAVLFGLGILIGLYLTWRSGWLLLLIGGAGFLLTLLYTKTKNCYLSDLTVFLIFGVLILLGTVYVTIGTLDWSVLMLSLPLGCITLSVLHANNTVDIQTDAAAGLHTIAMVMGERRATRLYILYQIIPFLCILLVVLLGWLPWTALLCFLALIPAIGNIKQARSYAVVGRDALKGLDLRSAKLQLLFSLTLTFGLFVDALFL